MLRVNPYAEHVAACLLSFSSPRSPWQRRLWTIGPALGIQEAVEASDAAAEGHLSDRACRDVRTAIIRDVGQDPGVGDAPQRRALQQCLKSDLRRESGQYILLEEIHERVQTGYLSRWSQAMESAVDRPRPERAARAIASHLLDAGFTPEYLHRWFYYRFHHGNAMTLSEILQEAADSVAAEPKTFKVLLPVKATPRTRSNMPSSWLTAPAASSWLRDNGFSTSGLRQAGGFLMEIPARDAWGALEIANERLELISARVALGVRATTRDCGYGWIAGHKDPFPLHNVRRGVEIRALEREHRLYESESQSRLDSALELVAPLNSGAPSTAIAGGWATVETLLLGPGDSGDRGVAGDRMATIIACSFVRAECTKVAFAHIEAANDTLASDLDNAGSNRQRAEILEKSIHADLPLMLKDPADRVASARIQAILANPLRSLRDIETYLTAALRRFYRQRNLVLHSGKTQAVALRAALRTAAPLIGAGLDRLTHSYYTEGLQPLELAARARLNLDLLESSDGVSPLLLLEPRR